MHPNDTIKSARWCERSSGGILCGNLTSVCIPFNLQKLKYVGCRLACHSDVRIALNVTLKTPFSLFTCSSSLGGEVNSWAVLQDNFQVVSCCKTKITFLYFTFYITTISRFVMDTQHKPLIWYFIRQNPREHTYSTTIIDYYIRMGLKKKLILRILLNLLVQH